MHAGHQPGTLAPSANVCSNSQPCAQRHSRRIPSASPADPTASSSSHGVHPQCRAMRMSAAASNLNGGGNDPAPRAAAAASGCALRRQIHRGHQKCSRRTMSAVACGRMQDARRTQDTRGGRAGRAVAGDASRSRVGIQFGGANAPARCGHASSATRPAPGGQVWLKCTRRENSARWPASVQIRELLCRAMGAHGVQRACTCSSSSSGLLPSDGSESASRSRGASDDDPAFGGGGGSVSSADRSMMSAMRGAGCLNRGGGERARRESVRCSRYLLSRLIHR